MDEQMKSLIPGQMVTLDGAIYLVVQTEDGSIALQEIKDYQHAVSQDNFCSFENFENLEATQTDFSHPNFNNVSEVVQKDDQTNLVQVQTFSEPHAQIVVNKEAPQTLSVEDQQNVSSYIRELQDKGYVFESETMNLLMSGAVNISDLRFEQGNDTLQTCESEEFRGSVNNLATGNAEHESLPDSNEHMLLEMTPDAQSNETGISLDENRKLKVMAFVQDAQNRGFNISNEIIEALMNGVFDISDCKIAEESDASNNVVTSNCVHNSQNEILHQNQTLGENTACQNVQQSNGNIVMFMEADDDEELLFFKNMAKPDASNNHEQVEKEQVVNRFFQAFVNFLESYRDDYVDKLLGKEVRAPYVESQNKTYPSGYPYSHGKAPTRGRRSARAGIHGIVPKRRNEYDDSDYEYEDHRWNPKEDIECSSMLPPLKRKVGRPRGSGRKRVDEGSDYDYSGSNSSSSDENLARRGRGRPNRSFDSKFKSTRGSFNHSEGYRGRGRPRKNPLPDVFQSQVEMTDFGEVLHSSVYYDQFEVGEYLVDRDNMFQNGMHNAYRVSSGQMMIVYSSFIEANEIFHRSTQVCMGNGLERRSLYTPVNVIPIEKLGKDAEIIKVIPINEGRQIENMSNYPLLASFQVYVQILICRFLKEDILDEPAGQSYRELLHEVDKIIEDCLCSIQSMIAWKPDFKKSLDDLPYYKICSMDGMRRNTHHPYQEADYPNLVADRVITLFGPRYDYENLRIIEGNEKNSWDATEYETGSLSVFFMNASSVEFVRLYHSLRHFKSAMFKEAKHAFINKQVKDKKKAKLAEEIMTDVLRDDTWIHYHLMTLKDLFTSSGIILEGLN